MTSFLFSAVKNYAANYSGLPAKCWEGIALTFINAISIGVCYFLSIYLVDALHISVVTASILISCYGFGTVIGGLVVGKLCDSISSRNVSTISLLIQSIMFFALAKINNVEWLAIILFILGVGSYGFKISNNLWLLNQCRASTEIRLRTIGITHVALNLGLGLSSILIAELIGHGFQNIFYLSGMLLFLLAIYLSFQKREQKYIKEHSSEEIEFNNNLSKETYRAKNIVPFQFNSDRLKFTLEQESHGLAA